ncbi:hypothetical protein PG985_008967 [Apiospora marii]|uniref:Uncharacterized protein n=1 Tax=Apiospora marii TaxID=335849 RepID=A0ABR1RB10_9PEZI
MYECLDNPPGGCFETAKDSRQEVLDRRPCVRDGIAHVTEKTFDPAFDILFWWKLPNGHKSSGRVTKVLVRSDRRSHSGLLHAVGG